MPGSSLTVGVILYPDFDTLDVMGPVELFAVPILQDKFKLVFISRDGQPVTSAAGVKVVPDHSWDTHPPLDVLLVPGGPGARQLVKDYTFLDWLATIYHGRQHKKLQYLMSVCTGSALLGKSGLLDEKTATSNNMAFDWVRSQSESTIWVKRARWVEDGNILTSSGVSAGMDMTMFFIDKIAGATIVNKVAAYTEYDGQWTNSHADKWA